MEEARAASIRNLLAVSILFFFLLITCYSNSFRASWQLDDKPNIINNFRLHIDNLMPETIWNTFHAKPGDTRPLYRPISNLSFALNWYLGQDNPFGYHLVNLAIHLTIAIVLYSTILLLLSTPVIVGRIPDPGIQFTAILGAVLWAINPIHTQAVTYIVQRMAILAALFYLLGIFLYMKGRLTRERSMKIVFFTGCLISYFFALGSKENAIMLPVSLLMLEWIFFRADQRMIVKRNHVLGVAGGLLVFCGFAWLIAVVFDGFDFLSRGYENRPFTLLERVMTEARIVIWYLGLVIYPSPHRLSAAHDVSLSTSLLSPWMTLPAMLAIVVLATLSVWRANRNPLFSFAILFFLINHVVESSFLPLELIFEHRNYLPSLFIFLPIAAGVSHFLDARVQQSKTTYFLTIFSIPLLLVALGWSTYIRNEVWQTETSLWEDAMTKVQNNARPLTSLADVIAAKKDPSPKDLDRALSLYFKSLQMDKARTDIDPGIIGNMANIYIKKQDPHMAIQLYRKALERDPGYTYARYNLSVVLNATGDLDAAEREIDTILDEGYIDADYFNLKGNLLLWRNQPQAALIQFRKALALNEDKARAFVGMGAALNALGHHRQAAWFLRLAHNANPDAIATLFLLIENALNADNTIDAERWTEQLLNDHSLGSIENWLRRLPTFYQMPPVSVAQIGETIRERALTLSETIESVNH